MHGFPELPEIFERLCDAPRAEQEHQLALITDPALRDRLSVLLQADRVASRVMGTEADSGGAAVLARDLANETLPERIGPFQILQRLGAGAMGVVYEARQEHPQRLVALKRLHPWLQSDLALQLFRFEAQALGQVNHPSIPVVYEAGEAEGAAYLTMERVFGLPLLNWVHQSHASVEERVRLLIAIARAVQAAHQAELVHRDLKPDNILVTDEGLPKLLDFGVAAPLLSRQSGAQPGTPLYMSPEQARGEPVGTASDVHALGTIAYQLLTGDLPVTRGNLEEIAAAKSVLPRRADQLDPAIDVDVARVIERALRPDPDTRGTAADVADDLERALNAIPLPWVAPTLSYRLGRFSRRHRRMLRLGLAGFLGLGVVLCGVLLTSHYQERLRLQTAEERRVRMVQRAEAALENGEFDSASQALHDFVEDPSHAWTPARVNAWLWWAEHLRKNDRSTGLDELAEAWLAANDAESSDRVGLALARRFQIDSSWSELWRLREVLSPTARERAVEPLRQAAIARRDFGAALALGGESAAMLTQLSRAIRTDIDGDRGAWIDVDGDGVEEIVSVGVGVTRLHDQLGGRELGAIPAEGEVGWLTFYHYQFHDGEFWIGSEARGGSLDAYRLTPNGPVATRSHRDLGAGRLLGIDVLEAPEGTQVLRAMGYPSRHLAWVDLESGPIPSRHPPTDALGSDVMAVEIADLDGDGVEEIIVALGAWNADEVRVLRQVEGRYALSGREPLGTVQDLAIIPRPGQNPLILANKGDVEVNRRKYSAASPFGPEAGFYLLEWTGEALEQVDFVPLPIPDGPASLPEKHAELPFIGDFDGDGTLDVASTLVQFDLQPRTPAWILLDLLGEQRNLVIAGINVGGATDVDGDGDDELLVADYSGVHYILGTGDSHLEVWDKPEVTTSLPPPPDADALVVRGWERAQQLVAIGMPAEATAALSELPGVAEHPDASLAATLAAAQLHEAAGDPDEASRQYAEVHTARPADEEVTKGLIRSRIAMLDLDGAREAAEGLDAPEHAWLESVVPRARLLDADSVANWSLQSAGALRRANGALEIEAYNDQGVLATLPIRIEGPVVGVSMKVTVHALELGAGLAVDIVGGPAERETMVAFWGQGGGGTTKLYQHCGDMNVRDLRAPLLHIGAHLELQTLRSGVDDMLRCRSSLDGDVMLVPYPSAPPIPGDYILRLRVHGVADFHPPTRVVATVHDIEGTGIVPLDNPKKLQNEARLALFDGRLAPGLPSEEAAWSALASGDEPALLAALGDLWKHGDRARLRWLIRGHGSDVVAPLAEIAGPEFAALFMEAWRAVTGSVERQPEFDLELLRPSLASLPPADPAGAKLRLLRARIRSDNGERGRARALVESVLEATDQTALRIDAWLQLATIAEDPSRRTRAVRNAIELDPSGRTADRARRAGLLDAD